LPAEGLVPYSWGNGPHDTYAAHSHEYDKVIYVVSGSIVFGLPEQGTAFELKAGDRLDLPKGTVHVAQVGREGVTCLEAHKEQEKTPERSGVFVRDRGQC
jgi:quercetin dioxygenase-like cupin family protein